MESPSASAIRIKRAPSEQQLRESHAHLRSLLDHATNFVLYRVAVDPQNPYGGRVVLVSESIREIVGVAEPYRFESWFEHVHPDDLTRTVEAVRRAAEHGEPFDESLRVYHPQKRAWRWIQAIATPVVNGDGMSAYHNGIILDITAQKQAEAQLQQRIAFENLVTSISKNFINLAPSQIDAGIQQALQAIGEFAEVDRSYLFRFADDQRTLDNTYEWCAPGVEPQIERMQSLPLEAYQWSLAKVRRLEVLHIPCVDALPADACAEQREFQFQGIKSLVVVPLVYRGEAIGFLGFDSIRRERAWSDESIALLKMVSDILVMALERKQAAEAVAAAAATERNRLARELHDSVTQTLFSASLIAEVLPRLSERNPDEARRRLEELRQLTRGALAEMRTLLLELRPSALSEVPLNELLRQLVEAAMGRSRVPMTLTIEGEHAPPTEVRIALYRIAQEALNNVTKHAAAQHASLSLCCCQPQRVEMRIGDDGRGFDTRFISSEHLGLDIMRERADAIHATLRVESEPGRGTHVSLLWAGTPERRADERA